MSTQKQEIFINTISIAEKYKEKIIKIYNETKVSSNRCYLFILTESFLAYMYSREIVHLMNDRGIVHMMERNELTETEKENVIQIIQESHYFAEKTRNIITLSLRLHCFYKSQTLVDVINEYEEKMDDAYSQIVAKIGKLDCTIQDITQVVKLCIDSYKYMCTIEYITTDETNVSNIVKYIKSLMDEIERVTNNVMKKIILFSTDKETEKILRNIIYQAAE